MNEKFDTTVPNSYSDLDEAESSVVGSELSRLINEGTIVEIRAFIALLLDRTIYLLQERSRHEMLSESLALSKHLLGHSGESLLRQFGDAHTRISLLSELLHEAGCRSSRGAIRSILLDSHGQGESILKLLASRNHPISIDKLRDQTGLSEPDLKRILYDLEEADLLVQLPTLGPKSGMVTLGTAGLEFFQQVQSQLLALHHQPFASGVTNVEAQLRSEWATHGLAKSPTGKLLAKLMPQPSLGHFELLRAAADS